MATLDDLSKQQREALEKLVEKTQDVGFDRLCLLRFLRAKSFDVRKAEEMVRARLVWKAELDKNYFQDRYDEWKPPTEVASGFCIYDCGRNTSGQPVYYAPLGSWVSPRDMYQKGMEDDCMRYVGKCMEQVYRFLLTTKKQNFVCIVDNMGVTVRRAIYEAQNYAFVRNLIRLFRDYEANFPNTLHKAYLINTPRSFYWGFNIVKPFMTKTSLDKITIFTSDENQWLPVLHDNLPLNTIPPKFGGTSNMIPLWPTDESGQGTDYVEKK